MSKKRRLLALFIRAVYLMGYPVAALALHGSNRVRVLVISKDKVLLQRTSVGSQKWSLPGGGIHKAETARGAAIRETLEETGVDLSSAEIFPLVDVKYQGSKWPQINRLFVYANIKEAKEPKITRPLEVIEVSWFHLDNLPSGRSSTVDAAIRSLSKTPKTKSHMLK